MSIRGARSVEVRAGSCEEILARTARAPGPAACFVFAIGIEPGYFPANPSPEWFEEIATMYINNNFLGIEWHTWKVIGWLGNGVFFSRFILQWIATEKRKRVVIPVAFWWLSLAGSLILLVYGLFYLQDSVVIFAYAFTWIPYIRNIVIHYRHKSAQIQCRACDAHAAAHAKYCQQCGTKLAVAAEPEMSTR